MLPCATALDAAAFSYPLGWGDAGPSCGDDESKGREAIKEFVCSDNGSVIAGLYYFDDDERTV